jgi:beta-barrel assembly-enhancing protease
MRGQVRRRVVARRSLSITALLVLLGGTVPAQTPISPPKNKYTPEQDVELGRKAAAEVRQQYPVIADAAIVEYLEGLGRQLVAQAPRALEQPAFEYSFTPVNLKEINAFALPGGPMFVNRGMFDAAGSEGEVVGVMAHELSHVLLRHGTANMTKAQGFQLGAVAGAIAGAVVGGGVGSVIAQGSQFGLGTWLLKYSREYEKQADLLGAQLMARAGYDPRDLARMFETIERESKGRSGPQWLSSHPNPGNRSTYIAREAELMRVARRSQTSRDFERIKSRLAALPPARSMTDRASRAGGEPPENAGVIGQPVPRPSANYRSVRTGSLLELSVPDNWRGFSQESSVKFAPPNAVGEVDGATVFTHGVELGVTKASSSDLTRATRNLLQSLAADNPELRARGDARATTMASRRALLTPLVNRSATGGQEHIGLYTAFLGNGDLFYYVTVVPTGEAGNYAAAFERVARSIRLLD